MRLYPMDFLTLHRRERREFVRAFIWLALIDIALRLPVLAHRVRRTFVAASFPVDRVDVEVIERAQRYAYWIDVASRHHVVRARCLHRSLVLHLWLQAEQLPSRLYIGVRKQGSELRAHAWVELAGQIVNDLPGVVDDFTPLEARSVSELWGYKVVSHG